VRRAALAALAALLLLAGCDSGDGSGLVFKDPKGTVEVEKGMTFSLEFSVNAGVGYDWEPVGAALDGSIVELVDTKVDYPDENRDGDSGKKRLVFEARSAGTQDVGLRKLFRGDEQERRTVTIRVRG
jgi:predicted secreted protein